MTPEDRKQLGRVRSKQTRWENNHKKRGQQVEHLSRELARLGEQSQSVEKTQSRLEQCIDQNVFYRTLAPFRKAYDNYRDDHDQFRQLTYSVMPSMV
ncbi:MAG TPA: hypothetical protein EYQ50_05660 [Verrucomicrobiales bacterium]|nr:hypothetical protein [Verrucomicrobiales bacterium]